MGHKFERKVAIFLTFVAHLLMYPVLVVSCAIDFSNRTNTNVPIQSFLFRCAVGLSDGLPTDFLPPNEQKYPAG